jgi:hypothetical protein
VGWGWSLGWGGKGEGGVRVRRKKVAMEIWRNLAPGPALTLGSGKLKARSGILILGHSKERLISNPRDGQKCQTWPGNDAA